MADFSEPKDYIVGLLDQDNNPLTFADHTVTSSDAAVGEVADAGSGTIGIAGRAIGNASLAFTRNADGATAPGLTIEITEGAAPGEFVVHFGTAVPI